MEIKAKIVFPLFLAVGKFYPSPNIPPHYKILLLSVLRFGSLYENNHIVPFSNVNSFINDLNFVDFWKREMFRWILAQDGLRFYDSFTSFTKNLRLCFALITPLLYMLGPPLD